MKEIPDQEEDLFPEVPKQGDLFPELPKEDRHGVALKKIIKKHEIFDEVRKKETPESRLRKIAAEIRETNKPNPNWENLRKAREDYKNKK